MFLISPVTQIPLPLTAGNFTAPWPRRPPLDGASPAPLGRPLVCLSVCPSVCPSVRPSFSVSTEQPSLTLIAIIQGTCNSVSTRHCIRSSRSTVIVLLRFYPISYPCCISVLLYHIHSRQLVWKEIASPHSRIINLLVTRY